MVEYHPISAHDQSRLHQFGPKVLPGIFFGYALHAGGIWKGDILIAHIEELEQMDASELHTRRLNAKQVLTPMRGDNFKFPVADGTFEISGGDQRLRTSTLIRNRPDWGEEQDILQRKIRRTLFSNPTSRWLNTWWCGSWKWFLVHYGGFIYRRHVEPRVKLYMSREESLLLPLKYIDVSRTTRTSLNVLKIIGKFMEKRKLSGAWTSFHNMHFIDWEATLTDLHGLVREVTKKHTTSRPDNVWPDMWKHMSDASKKAQPKWIIEKPKLR